MSKQLLMIIFASLFLVTAVSAGETSVTASNGVQIAISADTFADRYEYAAPKIDFEVPNNKGHGFAFVAAVKHGSKLVGPMIQAYVLYEDDWRHYSRAIFKGGAEADFVSGNRDVVTCSTDPCTLSEFFIIKLTKAQIDQHASGETLKLQVRGGGRGKFILSIPVSYFDALTEVAEAN